MEEQVIRLIVYAIIFVVPLIVTYLIEKYMENKRYSSIEEREEEMKNILIFNEKRVPSDIVGGNFHLVRGSIVISGSYWKQFLTRVKSFFGGRLNSLESIMDIGRREAILRMKEQAKKAGADTIFSVRFETTTLGSMVGKEGIFCAEFYAYGTAWKRR